MNSDTHREGIFLYFPIFFCTFSRMNEEEELQKREKKRKNKKLWKGKVTSSSHLAG